MATTVNVSSGYNGSLAGEIFVQAFKKGDTIAKGAITPITNVIGTAYLPKVTYSNGLSAYSCGFASTGTVGYTDKAIITKKFEIKDTLCRDDFHSTFQAQAQGLFSADNVIPSDIQDALLKAMTDNMGEVIDFEIWQGDDSASSFNGLLDQFVADSSVIDVTISAVTKANVVAQLDLAYDAIPAEIEDASDLVIAVSKNVAKAYKQAQSDMHNNTTVGNKELDYLGVRMESLGGLPANTIVIYRVKNVVFATSTEQDSNSVKIEDRDMEGDIRTKIVFSGNVGYSEGSEIVYARPA